MNFIQSIILNSILLIFPLLIYLLYQVYSKTLNKEKNELYLDVALVSSFYLIIEYGSNDYMMLLLINIPLILSYLFKRKLSTIILLILVIIGYKENINIPVIIIIIEYLIYYVLYLIYSKKIEETKNSIHIFLILKIIVVLIEYNYYFEISYSEMIISTITFYFETLIVSILFKKTDNILKLYRTIQELQEEKQVRDSLFKITHEIKNPIAVCKGYLDMFDTDNLEHSRKYVPIIKSEIERVLILLKDFLEIKKIKIEPDVMDINLLLDEVVESFKPLIIDRKIEILYNNNDDELYIVADYNRLKQVFVNMIKNSIEALEGMSKGKIKIEVNESNKDIVIKIIDNGCGIDKETLKHMNEPFFTTKVYGTGLGVFLSREIVKAHEGELKYISENNKTITMIILPKKKGY